MFEESQMNDENPLKTETFLSDGRYQPVLILIGGGAASGKSRISVEVVRRISNSVLLDKDGLYAEWVDALLAASGHPADRDCAFYWDCIRPLEYKSLERLAFDHLRLGKVVVIDAPLRPELDDPNWIRRVGLACQEMGAKLVATWIEVSPDCARERMRHRSEPRDRWKLENWDEFVRRQPYGAPCAAKLTLRNDDILMGKSAVSSIIASVPPS
jgi:predicted kinase